MSSLPNTSLLFGRLGLFPESTWCTHTGVPIPSSSSQQAASDDDSNGEADDELQEYCSEKGQFILACRVGSDEIGEYPYNFAAAIVIDQIRLHSDITTTVPLPVLVFPFLVRNRSLVPRINENMVKSLPVVMIGTDLTMRTYSHGGEESELKANVAKVLAGVILFIEAYLEFEGTDEERLELFSDMDEPQKLPPKVVQGIASLDCMRDVILFFDMRNACSCLSQAKEQHPTSMGRCSYDGFSQYTLDSKLFNCTGCMLIKYCNGSCQRADWPEHKHLCRLMQKKQKQSKTTTTQP